MDKWMDKQMDMKISQEWYRIANQLEKHYRYEKIPKKNGGLRLLTVPSKSLRNIQRQILDNIISFFPVHSAATAFLPGSSILCNAKYHTQYPVILKLDLRDFFNTITYSRVLGLFRMHTRFSKAQCVLFSTLCCMDGHLPQGAPTSPALANAVFYEIDAYSQRKDINYTRYADDLTFSGDFDPLETARFVQDTLRLEHVSRTLPYAQSDKKPFRIHFGKTKVYRSGQRQIVTGILVNEKLQTTKAYRRQIRQEIHYIQKHGVDSHVNYVNFSGTDRQCMMSLLGRVSHVLFINPDDEEFIHYKLFLRKALIGMTLSMEPVTRPEAEMKKEYP